MKKYLSTLVAVMLAALSFTLTSCGDDDEKDEPSTNAELVGTWHNNIRTEMTWDDEPFVIEENTYWQFKSDGTCICIVDNGDDVDIERSTWKRNGNALTLNHPGESETMTIKTLTKDKLIVSEMGITLEFNRVSDSSIDKYL